MRHRESKTRKWKGSGLGEANRQIYQIKMIWVVSASNRNEYPECSWG
jgi:hypothetical protein